MSLLPKIYAESTRPRDAIDKEYEHLSQLHPPVFAEYALGLKLDPWQVATLKSVGENERTAVVACNGAGKTLVAASALMWFLYAHEPSIVITTAASATQVASQLWEEVHRIRRDAPFTFPGSENQVSIHISPGHFAVGRSTSPGRFEGYHQKNIMLVVDEGKSVPDEIFDACERIVSRGELIRYLVISSPSGKSGRFYDCFTKLRERYKCIRVSAMPSPSADFVSSRIRKEWIDQMRDDYGGDNSPLFKSAVMAEFFDEAENTLIPSELVLAASKRQRVAVEGSVRTMGVDCARFGQDESVIVVQQDSIILELHARHGIDTMEQSGNVIALANKWDVEPSNVFIDEGAMGGGVIDSVNEKWGRVRGVQFGGSADDPVRFSNKAAEMWWRAKQRFESGEAVIPDDSKLIGQLVTRRFKNDSHGRIQLESKDDVRDRGMKSPDRADAYVQALGAKIARPKMEAIEI